MRPVLKSCRPARPARSRLLRAGRRRLRRGRGRLSDHYEMLHWRRAGGRACSAVPPWLRTASSARPPTTASTSSSVAAVDDAASVGTANRGLSSWSTLSSRDRPRGCRILPRRWRRGPARPHVPGEAREGAYDEGETAHVRDHIELGHEGSCHDTVGCFVTECDTVRHSLRALAAMSLLHHHRPSGSGPEGL